MASDLIGIKDTLSRRKIPIIALLATLAGAYVAIPQLGFFDTNWQALASLNLLQFCYAIALLFVSFAAAAAVYLCLSTRRLGFGKTYLVQMAGAFAGKVLPAGLGSISVNYLYLRKQHLSATTAATTVASNNILGFISHGLWTSALIGIWVGTGNKLELANISKQFVLVGIGITVCVVIGGYLLLQRRFRKSLQQITSQLRTYRRQYWRILFGLLASILLTGCTIGLVYLSAQAVGSPISFVAAAVALTAGLLAQTITPTPGGIGGVEAGLAGGLVLAGLDSSQAILVTITFRLVSFWLPLLFGGLALVLVLKRKLI